MITPKDIKVPEFSIYSRAPLDLPLVDKRISTYGLSFGTIRSVAKNFGIKCSDTGTCIKFTAPKNRLQRFMEKLHFSMIRYSQRPI